MIALGIRYFFVSEWLLIVPQCFSFPKETCPALIIGVHPNESYRQL